jgi:histone-lysine N-methyltransferase SETD3
MLLDRARGEAAQFKYYYDSLPIVYDEIPMCWPESELAWLQGSQACVSAKALKESIESDYFRVLEIAPEFRVATKNGLQDWMWARLSVCSRCFGITVAGVETMAQVPFGDMTNHKRPPQCRWGYEDSSQQLTFTALQDFEPGGYTYFINHSHSSIAILIKYRCFFLPRRRDLWHVWDEVQQSFLLLLWICHRAEC